MQYFLVECPRHEIVGAQAAVYLKEYLQDRDECGKGEDIQHGGKDVEYHRQDEISLVGRQKTPQDLQELFHKM
ncbi:hypothetical protein PRBRB14_05570 [Hallella multisaccharivorax DSM 17128]|nr:hypothetical protein PRBRB14_05570 [Hallella multisaccharivorax DSM 17128]